MNTAPEQRWVFARFADDDILDEMGRLLYSILNIFATNGYQIKLFNNIDFSALDKYGQLVPTMSNLQLVDTSELRLDSLCVGDQGNSIPTASHTVGDR